MAYNAPYSGATGPGDILKYDNGYSGTNAGKYNHHYFTIDAHRCSDVYGASDTVTPSSLTSQFIIKC